MGFIFFHFISKKFGVSKSDAISRICSIVGFCRFLTRRIMKRQHFGHRTVIRVLIKGLSHPDCPVSARTDCSVVQVTCDIPTRFNSSAAGSFSRFTVNFLAAFITEVNASYEIHITVSRSLNRSFSSFAPPLSSSTVAM